jgi:hypothetical protein
VKSLSRRSSSPKIFAASASGIPSRRSSLSSAKRLHFAVRSVHVCVHAGVVCVCGGGVGGRRAFCRGASRRRRLLLASARHARA